MATSIELRHALHAHPELSSREQATMERLAAFFAPLAPDETIAGLGGTGIAFAFGRAGGGPTVLLRSELDALPIAEANEMPYRSRQDGVSHKCGHDGHMAILAEVGRRLSQDRPGRGRVVLLYQPAEETGAGAAAVLADPAFERIRPDSVFALHNVPGYPLGQVIVRDGTFACASRGMHIRLTGRTAHAAEPETGASPAAALATIVTAFGQLSVAPGEGRELRLVTVVGAAMGGPNYGIAPGEGELHATLRSETDATMAGLVNHCEAIAREQAAQHGLGIDIDYHEVFDATVNAPAAVDTIRQACRDLDVREAEQPFRWSEDFGRFTQVAEGAFFGLGAGTGIPDLHHRDYDFPDALIDAGARTFLRIVGERLGGAAR